MEEFQLFNIKIDQVYRFGKLGQKMQNLCLIMIKLISVMDKEMVIYKFREILYKNCLRLIEDFFFELRDIRKKLILFLIKVKNNGKKVLFIRDKF